MLAIFLKTLPFFALIGLGYLALRLRILNEAASAALTKFVFYFALSAMLFKLSASLPLAEIWNPSLIGAYLGATGALYALQFALSRARGVPLAEAAIEAQCTTIGNTGFLGVPMLAVLFGPASVAPILAVLVVDTIVFSSLVTLLITAAQGQSRSLGPLLLGLVKNPMIVAMIAGFAWTGLGLPLSAPLHETLTILGAAATPCALFAIGASLAGRSLDRVMVSSWLSFAKMVLHPAAVALFTLVLFDLPKEISGVLIAAAALPVAGNIYILAQHYGVAPQRVSTSILISTTASIVTIPVIIAWINGL